MNDVSSLSRNALIDYSEKLVAGMGAVLANFGRGV
jgi:hypothetical protein